MTDAILQARSAMADALSGWRYIRDHYGDLYGVGWDRVETGLKAALATTIESRPRRNGGRVMTAPIYGWAVKGPDGALQTNWTRLHEMDAWDAAVCWFDDEEDDDFWNLAVSDVEHLQALGYRVVRVKIEEVEG